MFSQFPMGVIKLFNNYSNNSSSKQQQCKQQC